MIPARQQGSAILVTITAIFALSLLLLQAMHQHLDKMLLITRNEQHYLRSYNLAASSLNWGLNQAWPVSQINGSLFTHSKQWFCQYHTEESLTACIKPGTLQNTFVLKGEGLASRYTQKMALYQRVRIDFESLTQAGIKVASLAQGWLDFCPEKDAGFCAD
ncbi:hypothetical protein BD65_1223 [Yersinia ruckeri]|uniref:YgdB family protein n=1 Tax=Yersinia ruckeri TaxID=29486 RepID=UPI0005ACB674|nr:YgdB family protein [Yersinia ruckeri]AJI94402.1 hypothetical protein BD65_1223 [Yersinia ruckeri]MCW6567385.1 YgdB family protein [Yersinia ruckeri]